MTVDCARIPEVCDTVVFWSSTAGSHVASDGVVAGVVQKAQSVDAIMARN